MKKINFLMAFAMVLALGLSETMQAQKFSGLDKSPMDGASYPASYKISDKIVRIVYGRPQLNGRALDSLAKKGEVYRTGANEAAEITFFKPVTFGGKSVAAGTYSLFTIPGDKEWTVILSSARNVWGSYFYKESEDVVRVQGAVSKTETPIEAFSIVFEGEGNDATMYLGWADTIVAVPIKG